jgi:N-carbamoylputrescine amidase
MSRIVRCGLVQARHEVDGREPVEVHKRAAIEKHLELIDRAARSGIQILCLQELFFGPYFCAEQDDRWYAAAEPVPDGPTIRLMRDTAREHGMVLIVPVYEKELSGVFYNTAAVIDADGTFIGKTRKAHIPHCHAGEDQTHPYGFWEKFYFRPGNLGYPVFDTSLARIGVYICYDRHFPEGGRALGLHGAEIVFNPSATTAGHADYLWKLEQPAMAVANGYFVGAVNRAGWEPPWNIGEFFGGSYFVDPDGRILAEATGAEDEIVCAELDLDQIDRVRAHWQFYRDRRPDTYADLVADLP